MNVAEYTIEFLARHGVEDVFMVSGGGIMYLVDALGQARTPRYWCNYHEQASAIAAEGYARLRGSPGACLVTTGPGATNALSGIAGAWVDSIPVIVISGQVRRELIADHTRWRQLGPQEIDIVAMAKGITKFAVEVDSADAVPAALEAAWLAATSGRPGPVWISLPLDVQGADIETWLSVEPPSVVHSHESVDPALIGQVLSRLRDAKRPVILAGNGIHLARAEDLFDEFVRQVGIPVVATIGAMDLLGEDHPYFAGRFGPTGQRRANFVVQNADVLLSLGSGMSVAAIGFDSEGFAPHAAKIMVNVDQEEMTRPHLAAEMTVAMDVRDFMAALRRSISATERFGSEQWTTMWRSWKVQYPIVTHDYLEDPQHVNSYYLAHRLSEALDNTDVVLTGNSLDAHSVFHSFAVKRGQRVVTNVNYGAMGWDLPALVGVAVARGGRRVILVTGDGSIAFNCQELLTIGSRRLNAYIFVLNNMGYQSIRSTQGRYFDGRLVGSDNASGVANPSFRALSEAFGLEYHFLGSNDDVDERIDAILSESGPVLCEVNVDYSQERVPRVTSQRQQDGSLRSGRLHDQYPFLPPDEIEAIMRASGA